MLRTESLAVAQRLARLLDGAALEMRAAFEAAASNAMETQLAYEAAQQAVLIDRMSFAEKREPDFSRRSSPPNRPIRRWRFRA